MNCESCRTSRNISLVGVSECECVEIYLNTLNPWVSYIALQLDGWYGGCTISHVLSTDYVVTNKQETIYNNELLDPICNIVKHMLE